MIRVFFFFYVCLFDFYLSIEINVICYRRVVVSNRCNFIMTAVNKLNDNDKRQNKKKKTRKRRLVCLFYSYAGLVVTLPHHILRKILCLLEV